MLKYERQSFPRKFFLVNYPPDGVIVRHKVKHGLDISEINDHKEVYDIGSKLNSSSVYYYPSVFELLGSSEDIRAQENVCAKNLLSKSVSNTFYYRSIMEFVHAIPPILYKDYRLIIPYCKFTEWVSDKELVEHFEPCTHVECLKLGYCGVLKTSKGNLEVFVDEDNLFDDFVLFEIDTARLDIRRENYNMNCDKETFSEHVSMYILNSTQIVFGKCTLNSKKSVSMGCRVEAKHCSVCDIQNKRKQNKEKISEYRRKLQEELEAACVLSGGHYFYDWVCNRVRSICGDTLYTHRRDCRACDKRETKTEPGDV